MGWAVEIQWLTILLGVVTLVINSFVLVAVLTWKLSTVKQELSDDIIKHRDTLKDEMQTERRVVGESMSALRQKINDVELYGANNYVRRDAWDQAMTQLQSQLSSADKVAEQRILRLEAKMDRIIERVAT